MNETLIRRILEDAAKLIERDGWRRSQMKRPQGRWTVRWAIIEAARQIKKSQWGSPECFAAIDVAGELVGDPLLLDWNDKTCRGAAQAIKMLRKAAERLT